MMRYKVVIHYPGTSIKAVTRYVEARTIRDAIKELRLTVEEAFNAVFEEDENK